MTEPEPPPLSLATTAAEPPEESVAHEREAVGDDADEGGLVPPDDAQ
ncbi:MAG TPA: hypothetical protein VNU66_13380 [Mycobacteriales bacterium]|nr:hypothetical protein [Mycobacteriales bacterium]